ncbi:MAG: ABC transporter permease [Actinobacteria bacterium]|nr:ABC transporter permease [Actinomycetota bacterium]MCL6105108.1 ABC transporter permease [Actinomycetota bacterium]
MKLPDTTDQTPGEVSLSASVHRRRLVWPSACRDLIRMNLLMLLRNRQVLLFSLLFPLFVMLVFGGILKSGVQKVALSGPKDLTTLMAKFLPPRFFTPMYMSAAQANHDVALGNSSFALVVLNPNAHPLQIEVVENFHNASENGYYTSVAEAIELGVNQTLLHMGPAVIPKLDIIKSSGATVGGVLAMTHYTKFLTPGIIAYAVLTSSMLGASMRLVRDREQGTLRRIKATAVPMWVFVIGHVTAQLVLVAIQVAVLLTTARLLYGVGIGPLPAVVVLLLVVGSLCFLALGFLVAGIAKGEQAAMMIGNTIALPQMFLTGIFFPLSQAPEWMQKFALFMPLRYLSQGLREVMTNGASLADTSGDLLVLLAVGIAAVVLVLFTFRFDPLGAS